MFALNVDVGLVYCLSDGVFYIFNMSNPSSPQTVNGLALYPGESSKLQAYRCHLNLTCCVCIQVLEFRIWTERLLIVYLALTYTESSESTALSPDEHWLVGDYGVWDVSNKQNPKYSGWMGAGAGEYKPICFFELVRCSVWKECACVACSCLCICCVNAVFCVPMYL